MKLSKPEGGLTMFFSRRRFPDDVLVSWVFCSSKACWRFPAQAFGRGGYIRLSMTVTALTLSERRPGPLSSGALQAARG